ncbi:serine hydrolase domain-containing protein [Cellulosilyticum ruminicola]|uniref:serine hydrolase domain-containing protein n=1 Tax=Cellulosilyticum ruminicola TaxID=425254 RepID=UPI0006D18A18|nr:serine hydrolase domain-containing protein [Cellulosilyticum ruminicola]
MIKKVDEFIKKQMSQSKIPGCFVIVIHEGKTVLKNSYGYADVNNKIKVSNQTLFQLGSTSKALTASAILWMEEQLLLNRSDKINKYLPWFQAVYKGEKMDITIEQLLCHTSGIPGNTIMDIVETGEKSRLEECIYPFLPFHLKTMPGKRFEYATINYDLLGCIIESINKCSFKSFLQEKVLKPLGMINTYLLEEDIIGCEVSKGYKIEGLRAREYKAPFYRSNVPAGYYMMNGIDLEKWLKYQLNITSEHLLSKVIKVSHDTEQAALVKDNTYYGNGWYIDKQNEAIYHYGRNPNFVSNIYIWPNKKTGVAILANSNSGYLDYMCRKIIDILEEKNDVKKDPDIFVIADYIATFIDIGAVGCILWKVLMNRQFIMINLVSCLIGLLGIVSLFGVIYWMNNHLIKLKHKVSFMNVWVPKSLIYAVFFLIGGLIYAMVLLL